MPNKCFVPNCKSGYASERLKSNGKTISLFRAPKDIELLNKWKRKILRNDKKISSKDFVCELHFLLDDIMRHYELKIDGVIHKSDDKRKNPVLRQESIPLIFSNLPKYSSSSKLKKSAAKPRFQTRTKIKISIPVDTKKFTVVNKNYVLEDNMIHRDKLPIEVELMEIVSDIIKNAMASILSTEINVEHNNVVSIQDMFTVEYLHNVADKVVLPGNMWGMHQIPGKCTVFTHLNEELENDKIVYFSTTCLPDVKVNKKSVYFPIVKNFDELQNLLLNIHSFII